MAIIQFHQRNVHLMNYTKTETDETKHATKIHTCLQEISATVTKRKLLPGK
jgi:hypothetical protein